MNMFLRLVVAVANLVMKIVTESLTAGYAKLCMIDVYGSSWAGDFPFCSNNLKSTYT